MLKSTYGYQLPILGRKQRDNSNFCAEDLTWTIIISLHSCWPPMESHWWPTRPPDEAGPRSTSSSRSPYTSCSIPCQLRHRGRQQQEELWQRPQACGGLTAFALSPGAKSGEMTSRVLISPLLVPIQGFTSFIGATRTFFVLTLGPLANQCRGISLTPEASTPSIMASASTGTATIVAVPVAATGAPFGSRAQLSFGPP